MIGPGFPLARRCGTIAAGVPVIRIRVAVCLVDGDRVLLVEHEKDGRHYWLLPGGGVEAGETLADAAHREVREETGFEIDLGPLLILCEAIEPLGRRRTRHLVNVVYAGRITAGVLRPGHDGRLVDAAWRPVAELLTTPMYPPIGPHVHACWARGLEGPPLVLGNVWRQEADEDTRDSATG